MFIGAPNKELPITSTKRRSAVKKTKPLDSVLETPEASFVQKPRRKSLKADNKENLKESRVIISPIKKAAITKAFGPSATISPIKKAAIKKALETTPKPRLLKPKVQQQTSGVPGTPQPMDPANILKRNLKKQVEVQMDQKVQEIPNSPYTLLIGETENGSPVEHFVKMAKKPSKENVTGTPVPVRRSARKAFTPITENQNVQAGSGVKSPHPNPRNRLGTPKKLDMTTEAMEIETENKAVNKTLAKTGAAQAPGNAQMITGGLADMCAIM